MPVVNTLARLREFFDSGITKSYAFRIKQLELLKSALMTFEKDFYKAQILTRIFDNPRNEWHLPRPFGVFYENNRPCYEEMMTMQIETAKAKKPADLDRILRGGEVWTIN